MTEPNIQSVKAKAEQGDWRAQMEMALLEWKAQNWEDAYFWVSVVCETKKTKT